MHIADFYIKRGDRSPAIEAILRDKTGAAIDLSGKTVKFHMRSFLDGTLVINAVATPDPDQVNNKGKVSYNWDADDTNAGGYYYGEWEVDLGSGIKQTFPTIGYHFIDIVQDLDTDEIPAADFAEIRRLRTMVAEPSRDSFTDAFLHAMLLSNLSDTYATAAEVWRLKAAEYADIVDTSEGSSNRKLSQLYERAVKQAEYYESLSGTGAFVPTQSTTVIRKIER